MVSKFKDFSIHENLSYLRDQFSYLEDESVIFTIKYYKFLNKVSKVRYGSGAYLFKSFSYDGVENEFTLPSMIRDHYEIDYKFSSPRTDKDLILKTISIIDFISDETDFLFNFYIYHPLNGYLYLSDILESDVLYTSIRMYVV